MQRRAGGGDIGQGGAGGKDRVAQGGIAGGAAKCDWVVRELGFDVAALCWEGPEAELQLTANTQPAILTAFSTSSSSATLPTTVAGAATGSTRRAMRWAGACISLARTNLFITVAG